MATLVDGATALDVTALLNVLKAVHKGDFSVRLPQDWTGLAGKVADTLNEVIELNQRLAGELQRVSVVVGQQGRIQERASIGPVTGEWAQSVAHVNALVASLVQPTSEASRVIGAVAKGDLSQRMAVEIDDRPLEGELLRTANTVNRMVEQLGAFSAEVTRVVREVGTEGKLGGQATVRGAGTWKDLTDSVNSMAGNLTAQVRNIAEVTTAVANGDLSKKITVDVRGEVLELKNTINTMVDQLRSFASEVTRVAREVGTEGKLGGQARVEGVSGTWRDHKDEFLAMLSHELRNPLGAITTAVRVLDVVDPADERASRARAIIGRQSGHLSRMVDDLLDVARLTGGQIAVARAPVDLTEVVVRALDALRLAGRLDHHTVKLAVEPATVEVDLARMDQVVTNLIVNALKYTDRGGRVDVEVRREDDEAVLRVRDTGIGISAEMLPRLFDLFAQGRQALDRSQGGLGIGLTLVRRLVELHGGRVGAASNGLGQGSVFTVRLPLAAPRDRAGQDAARRDAAGGRLRVLVVEDNVDSREMLVTLLQLSGHDVHEAADGLEALQVAARIRPQIALIDLGLPRLDGLEVASRLRATPHGRAMFLVAVTGYGQERDRRRTAEAGFDFHLTKPVDGDRLDELLTLAARRCTVHPAMEPHDG